MFRQFNKLFFAPSDTSSGAIEDKELSVNEIDDFLKDDSPEEETIDLEDKKKSEVKEEKEEEEKSEEKPKKEEEEDEEEKPEDEEKLDELEEDLEEPDEDKLDVSEIHASKREILSKYPKLFKDFPFIERAMYRERAFTELLPTVDDAKEALDKSNTLDNFESDLLKGNTEKILASLKKSSIDSFNTAIDNLLPTLSKVDTNAFNYICGKIGANTVRAMLIEAKQSKNEQLEAAAILLNQFIFGTSDVKDVLPLGKVKTKNEAETQFEEKERALVQKQYTRASEDVNTKVNNVILATIKAHIDPKESMTDYVRKNAIRDANDALSELMSKNTRYKAINDKLWENAIKNDFDNESMQKIKNAYLSIAKTLLPGVIKKARIEGLKGLGKRVREEKEEEPVQGRARLPVGNSSPNNSSRKSTKEQAREIPKNMRTLDFLNKD